MFFEILSKVLAIITTITHPLVYVAFSPETFSALATILHYLAYLLAVAIVIVGVNFFNVGMIYRSQMKELREECKKCPGYESFDCLTCEDNLLRSYSSFSIFFCVTGMSLIVVEIVIVTILAG